MTIYQATPPPQVDDPSSTGRIPAVRRQRRLLRAVLAVIALVVIATVVVVEVYTGAGFSPDGTNPRSEVSNKVPEKVTDGGPVIDMRNGQPESLRMPKRTIALTFDDGPDPTWTPKILDVLAKYHAPATFFVVGTQVTRNPGLAERIVREGHEIGAHTFTHPDLARIPDWQRNLENSETQLAIAYATGRSTLMLRPPYSSFPDAITNSDYVTVTQAAQDGYLTVLDDMDSEDWQKPGVRQIVRNATPRGDDGEVILFHDAGGNREESVAALNVLIPQLQADGYTFTTVGAAMHMDVNPEASASAVWRGRAMAWTVRGSDGVLRLLWYLMIIAGGLIAIRTLVLFIFAWAHARQRRRSSWGSMDEPVTIVVPAYNEEKNIGAAVTSLAQSQHGGGVEVVVVDDGSTDSTADEIKKLKLPNVRLVQVPNGGKANALNTGMAFASNELIVMVDADTVVDPDSIHRLIQPFADETVGAVAGNVKVVNRRGLLGKWQHIEYVIGFSLDRRLYDTMGCISTIPGALGAFRRKALTQVGGLSEDTLAEDTDLTMAIQRAGWRVVYEESAKAYTEAPASLGQLWKQRYRWSYGTMQAMWKHRHALREKTRFGRGGLPLIALFSVLLPLLAPLIDLMAVYGFLFLDRKVTAIGWGAMMVVQVLTAVLAFRLDRESLRPLWSLPLQQIVYRQVMYMVLVHSALTAITGRRLRWQTIRRTGALTQGQPAG
ncbi:glycosyltransferase [Actinoplanes sp. TBRC 11911]|uniref:bifunctional polysaccharide deacetylase/glycosyltransferase family 2 protein n=1 Tax=Actinoplanes sp. TBRC 11911 TaxID=2729386 RepID=UPI00145E3383|nr:bifunctional polysaccharide deacetylase/glycosyltransferase family 2 protein [Actinoplanes sp. TBRC 11911]NMO53910.1 glycosyltransferase [Actinoplanes sp. TBRC 11911]